MPDFSNDMGSALPTKVTEFIKTAEPSLRDPMSHERFVGREQELIRFTTIVHEAVGRVATSLAPRGQAIVGPQEPASPPSSTR